MKNQLPVIANIKGLGDIVEVVSDYYTELQQLRDSDAMLISPRDEAYVRLYTRKKEKIGTVYGTRTTAGFEYVRGQFPIFRVYSRLNDLKLAKLAVNANKRRVYFHTKSTKDYEESLKEAEQDKNKEPKKRNVIILPSRDSFIITKKRNWEIYESILKDQAESYFKYNGPITVYPIEKSTVDAQNGTILNVLWFRSFEGGSILYGFSRNLNHDDRARGILRESSENIRNKKTNPTQKQIDQYLELVQKIKTGKISLSKLRKVIDFLEGLR